MLPHWSSALLLVILPGHVIVGTAFTITVAVTGVPTQPAGDVGVMVKVTVCGTVVILVSVPLMLPLPLAAIPVTFAVLSLVHAKVVPGMSAPGTIVVIGPEHTVCVKGATLATGNGSIVPFTGTLGEELQFCAVEYSNSILEILVAAPNSLQMSCGSFVVIGNCIPRRCNCIGNPAIDVL